MHEVFEDDDMRQIFRWLTKFLNNPYSEDDQLVPAGLVSCLLVTMHHVLLASVCGYDTSDQPKQDPGLL